MPENAVVGLDVAEIAASSLALPRRAEQMLTVVRRLVPQLGTPTRTLAAVRAERAGLYVPCVPGPARGEAL
jgi:hypothetical protein